MARKGIPRSRQHEWKPSPENEQRVYCEKCGITVHTNEARRGVGVCDGRAFAKGEDRQIERQELSPEDIQARLPQAKPFIPSGEDHGKCNVCGEELKEMPFNTRLAMIACNNGRCNLYRQRLRFIVRK